jgi:hypothetical protein
MSANSSVPVLSITRGSLCGMNGKVTGPEPGGNDRLLEADGPRVALVDDFELVERDELAYALDHRDLAQTDAYRKELDTAGKEKGYRVTLLAFLIKASVSALKLHPEFNASLSPEKDALIYQYVSVSISLPWRPKP